MSKQEIKYEINKVLDQLSDEALSELLSFLKELDLRQEKVNISSSLKQIILEDKELLTRLAQ